MFSRMNHFIHGLAALAVVAVVSCSKGMQLDPMAVPTEPDETGAVPVLFFSSFDATVETKAVQETTDANLSSFYVTAEGTSGGFSNLTFTSNAGTFSGGQYWPATNANYVFYASNNSLSSSKTVSVENTKDVVCAVKTDAVYKSTNTLRFDHIFARVGYCRVSAPSGYEVSNLKVEIVPKTAGTYSLPNGNGHSDATGWTGVTTAASRTVLASALNSTSDNGLYLVPGDYTLYASYTITKGAYSETVVDKQCNVSLVKGKRNNITATLPAGSAADLTFTVTVTAWTDQAVNANF